MSQKNEDTFSKSIQVTGLIIAALSLSLTTAQTIHTWDKKSDDRAEAALALAQHAPFLTRDKKISGSTASTADGWLDDPHERNSRTEAKETNQQDHTTSSSNTFAIQVDYDNFDKVNVAQLVRAALPGKPIPDGTATISVKVDDAEVTLSHEDDSTWKSTTRVHLIATETTSRRTRLDSWIEESETGINDDDAKTRSMRLAASRAASTILNCCRTNS